MHKTSFCNDCTYYVRLWNKSIADYTNPCNLFRCLNGTYNILLLWDELFSWAHGCRYLYPAFHKHENIAVKLRDFVLAGYEIKSTSYYLFLRLASHWIYRSLCNHRKCHFYNYSTIRRHFIVKIIGTQLSWCFVCTHKQMSEHMRSYK